MGAMLEVANVHSALYCWSLNLESRDLQFVNMTFTSCFPLKGIWPYHSNPIQFISLFLSYVV